MTTIQRQSRQDQRRVLAHGLQAWDNRDVDYYHPTGGATWVIATPDPVVSVVGTAKLLDYERRIREDATGLKAFRVVHTCTWNLTVRAARYDCPMRESYHRYGGEIATLKEIMEWFANGTLLRLGATLAKERAQAAGVARYDIDKAEIDIYGYGPDDDGRYRTFIARMMHRTEQMQRVAAGDYYPDTWAQPDGVLSTAG